MGFSGQARQRPKRINAGGLRARQIRMRAIANRQHAGFRDRPQYFHDGFINRRIGLADFKHIAAEFAVKIGQRASANYLLPRHHHMPIRIDAEHGQAGIETGAQYRTIGFRACRAAIRIRAGIQQEIRLAGFAHNFRRAIFHH